jgi:hypothetical protein
VVLHHVAVDLPGTGRDDVLGLGRAAGGAGGWRSAPQSPQRWIRSSPAAVPAQKNAVSREMAGRSTSAVEGDGEVGGWNFSIRHRIDATGSVPTYQVFRVVTNQPSPSDVRFGPVMPSMTARTVTCSPCRR